METMSNQNPTLAGVSNRRFPKRDRLRHRTLVEELFRQGKSIYDFPLRLVYRRLTRRELTESFRTGLPPRIAPVQMMVNVPKRKRRHAVDRVLLRRRIREAYRLNRQPLLQTYSDLGCDDAIHIAFLYLDNKNTDYATIEAKMKALLSRLCQKISTNTKSPC